MNAKVVIGAIVLGIASVLSLLYMRKQPDPGLGTIGAMLVSLITPFLGALVALRFRGNRTI